MLRSWLATRQSFTALKPKGLKMLALACGIIAGVAHGMTAPAERSLAGQLLVASDDMKDPRFAETVIYMIKHDDGGAFGLIVNKPIATATFAEVLQGFGIAGNGAKGGIMVHYGGPVNRQQGFILHSDELTFPSTTKVKDGIAMTAESKMIQALAQGQGPREALLIMGYAGWAPGQLENELKANSWFTIDGDKALVFGKDAEKKWRLAMDKRQIPL